MTPEKNDLDIERWKLISALAAHEHERWSCQARTALDAMDQRRRERWEIRSRTPYSKLSKDMKMKDIEQVKSIIQVIDDMGFDIVKKSSE